MRGLGEPIYYICGASRRAAEGAESPWSSPDLLARNLHVLSCTGLSAVSWGFCGASLGISDNLTWQGNKAASDSSHS